MTGLFERDPKAGRQGLHVVTQRLSRREVRRVRHQQRAGNIVEKADTDQHHRFRRRRRSLPQDGFYRIARFEQRELKGHVKSAAFSRQNLSKG